MNGISENARSARESARHRDGKFGSYELADAGTDADLDMSFLDDDGDAEATFGEPDRPHRHETPVEIDHQLQQLSREHSKIEHNLASCLHQMHTAAGDRRHYVGHAPRWQMSDDAAIEKVQRLAETDQTYVGSDARKALERLQRTEANLHESQTKINELHEEFDARGGWSRGWLALSTNGHVHRSQDCSTCNKRGQATSFELMADFSGQSEEEIVAGAGYRACTTCYPSAPVDATPASHPTAMYSRDEVEAQQERDKRAAAKAEKAKAALAKAPTVTGEPIEVHDYVFTNPAPKTLKTERAAEMWWIDQWEPEESNRNTPEMAQRYQAKATELEHVLEQLAAKKEVPVEELRQTLRAKAIKKNGYRWGI